MRKKIIVWGLLLLVILSAFPVRAQSPVGRIIIRKIGTDAENFPTVVVEGLVLDAEGVPVAGVPPEMFSITEDGQPVDFKMAEIDSGTRTALVLDMGKWINNNTVRSRDRVRDKIQALAIRFIDRMKENDQAEIIVVYGLEAIVIHAFTSDKTALRETVKGLDWKNDQESYGLKGIEKATTELVDTPDDIYKRVLFISAGIMMQDQFGKGDEEIAEELLSHNIPLYSVDVTWQERRDYYHRFEFIATETRGQFFKHVVAEDLDPLFLLLDSKRNVYQFTFRSLSGSGTERRVSLSYLGTSDVSDSSAYRVESAWIAPANIQILVNNGEPLILSSENPAASVPVHIMIDGLGNRAVRKVVFQINGQEYGKLNPTGTGTFSTNWQISKDSFSVGDNEVLLEVLVEDEFGITHPGSTAVPVRLEAPSDPLCRALANVPGLGSACVRNGFTLAGFLNIVLSLVIVAFGALIWFKRDLVVTKSKQIGTRVTNVVERLTNRLRKSEPKARLIALQGIPEGARMEFDLFGETPVGSSNSDASLVFDNPNISRLHCIIHEGHAGNWSVEDQESTNGTFVNGNKLIRFQEKEIESGDIIELSPVEYGGIKFRFEIINLFADDDTNALPYEQQEEAVPVGQPGTRRTQRFEAEASSEDAGDAIDPSDPSNQKW